MLLSRQAKKKLLSTVRNVTGCALSEQALHSLELFLTARRLEYCQVTHVEAKLEQMGSREQKADALFSNLALWLRPRLIDSMSFPSKTPCSCLMSAATTLTQSAIQGADILHYKVLTHSDASCGPQSRSRIRPVSDLPRSYSCLWSYLQYLARRRHLASERGEAKKSMCKMSTAANRHICVEFTLPTWHHRSYVSSSLEATPCPEPPQPPRCLVRTC